MLDEIRKSLRLLSPRLRWRWALMVPLMALAASIEAVGAAAVFGFLQVVASPDRIRQVPVAAALLARVPAPSDDRTIVVTFGVLLILFYLLRNVVLSLAAYLHEGLVQRSGREVSRRLLWGYLTVPYRFHLTRNSASLIQTVRDAVDNTYELVLASTLRIASEGLTTVALIAVLAAASPFATAIAVAVTIALVAVPNPITARFFTRSGEAHQRLDEELLLGLQQSFGALREVKLLGRERFFHDWISRRRDELGRIHHHRAALAAALRLLVETSFFCMMLVVVILVTLRLGTGADVITLLGLFGYATFRLVPAANRITLYLGYVRVGGAWVRSLYDDVVEVERAASAVSRAAGDARPTFATAIAFERVTFGYDQGAHAVWDVTLTIRRGESVGIVGRTGAGKSTLVSLLLGLLEPTGGRITVDGRDIREQLRGWQASIGYVPQDFFIFDDTLRRNIAFGLDDAAVDDARLAEAVRLARLDEVVAGLPQALDTMLGERGIRLSGGQRQRVAIARALYRQPDVLIFDEATAALDTATEGEIVRAIEALHGAKTLIVIAHRLSTVARSDRIVVMEAGRVVADGSYDALLRDQPAFRQLAGLAT